ncbi:MAG: hypothetical protein ACXVCN_18910 [Bdellovibrio sp.]
MKEMFSGLKSLLGRKSQLLLVLIFSGLYKGLSLIGAAPFRDSSLVARFFFEKDLKKNPKIKNGSNRYIHWHSFRPQKDETGISVYNITNLSENDAIVIGDRYVGKYKREKVFGYFFETIKSINEICQAESIPEFTPQYWPIPHRRHINLNPSIAEAQAQLRCQTLAIRMPKYLKSDNTAYHGQHF